MSVKTEFDYDIIVIGNAWFAAETALQLSETNLKILLLSQSDFADSKTNFSIYISKYKAKEDNLRFYRRYSHSIIPIKQYNLTKRNYALQAIKTLQSAVDKSVIGKKKYQKIEQSVKLLSGINIGIKDTFKVNTSRLCIDTVKLAKAKGIDILKCKKIAELGKDEIVLDSGKIITCKRIINTDIDLYKGTSKIDSVQQKTIRVNRPSLNLINPIHLQDSNKNIFEIIPYFTELIINSQTITNTDIILETINNTLGTNLNKNNIIDECNIENTSSNILLLDSVINIFESNFNNFEKKINVILEMISAQFDKEKIEYSYFKTFGSYKIEADKYNFVQMVEEKYLQVQETGVDPNYFTTLFYRYGTEIEKIIDKSYDFYNDKNTRNNAWLYAELWYSINHEFVSTFDDFTERRTDLGLLNQLSPENKDLINNYIENTKNAR